MKRIVAILVVLGIGVSSPLWCAAANPPTDPGSTPIVLSAPAGGQSTAPQDQGGGGQEQGSNLGDPDELGGGFRGNNTNQITPNSTSNQPSIVRWFNTLLQFITQLP
jgi:hypothetical protein